MPLHNRKLRSIVESDNASALLADAFKRFDRLEDVWICGDTWRLVRGPEQGVLLPTGERIMKFPSFLKLVQIPGRTILYRYNDNEIDIISVAFDEEV